MQKTISDKITIVVPCKNEENYIHHLLDALREQNIGNTRVIIADCSTDTTRQVIQDNSAGLNVEIIEGGPVSIAKNNGARLVTTPYILFIDADVSFFILARNYNGNFVTYCRLHTPSTLKLLNFNCHFIDASVVSQLIWSLNASSILPGTS